MSDCRRRDATNTRTRSKKNAQIHTERRQNRYSAHVWIYVCTHRQLHAPLLMKLLLHLVWSIAQAFNFSPSLHPSMRPVLTTHSFLQRDFGENKKIKISSPLLVSIWQICSVHVLSLFPTPALLRCFSFVLKHARNNPPVFPDPRFCTSTHTVLSHVSALHLLSSSCFHSQKNKQTTTTEQPASLGNIQQLETAWTKNVSVIEDGLLMPICQMEPITTFYFTFIVIKQLLETWKCSTLT